jgi:hypothetical protein
VEDEVIENSDPAADGMSPDKLLAELEARLLQLEAAGAEVPNVVKSQLERVRRLMGAGQAEGIQFMGGGDEESGLMGFSVPLESESSEDDPG